MSKTKARREIAEQHKPFSQLTGGQKMSFIGKACIFVITFGFAFPTIFSD